ncbi:sensor histidine kinase [Legionella quinlivanii]|uniref:sensor histidine kinase n=1 Tax=Legionella quinlivanii TaxID=45073 RepID=UPI0022442423|nr:HAMP domain-containing sensor histidine kinase [Legionella quinlivanii]MCW8451633.1 HAMP domain-containing histidine kinase [Legionella quinlivanii]
MFMGNAEKTNSIPDAEQMMRCLHQLSVQSTSNKNLYSLLQEHLALIIQLFKVSYVQLSLQDADTHQVLVEVGENLSVNPASILRLSQKAERIQNSFYIDNPLLTEGIANRLILIPLLSSAKTALGNLLIYWPHTQKPNDMSISCLELIAYHTGNLLQQREIESLSSLYKTTATEEGYAKKLFLAALSHDLRSPLTSILTWAQLLKTTSSPPDKLKTGLNFIEESALRQNKIIDNLIHISEVLLNKTPMEFEFTDVNSILNKSLQSVISLVQNRNLQVKKCLTPHPLIIRADSFRIKQVFCNLLANAIKFSFESGELLIKTEHLVLNKKSYAHIVFEDHGVGMKKEQLTRILRLFNEDNGIKAKEGMGIGLAFSAYLVKLHSGFMDAESKGENKGSIFKVMIPLV